MEEFKVRYKMLLITSILLIFFSGVILNYNPLVFMVETKNIPVFQQGLRSSNLVVLSWNPNEKRLHHSSDIYNCRTLRPGEKCFYTTDRTMYNKSHAVLIKALGTKSFGFPKYKLHHQKWIFMELESPAYTWTRINANQDVWHKFNLTSTFTPDSDIPCAPYKQNCTRNPDWKDCSRNISSCIDHAENKNGTAIWVVSHCRTISNREGYVKELKKYLKVDIFGGCGRTMDCKEYSAGGNCTKAFLHQYKFYLSFENSVCDGYYTEKLVKTLNVDTIPVVMGAYNYSRDIPKGK